MRRSLAQQLNFSVIQGLFMLFCSCHFPSNTKYSVLILYAKGLQTFLSEGHISYYATARGLDVLCSMIVSGYLTSLKSTNFSYIYYFSSLTNVFAGRVKGPRGPDLARGP